jgi:hypothetical protein
MRVPISGHVRKPGCSRRSIRRQLPGRGEHCLQEPPVRKLSRRGHAEVIANTVSVAHFVNALIPEASVERLECSDAGLAKRGCRLPVLDHCVCEESLQAAQEDFDALVPG